MKAESAAAVLKTLDIELARLRPDLPLAGSPERCLERAAAEDARGGLWVVERHAPAAAARKQEIAAAAAHLAARLYFGQPSARALLRRGVEINLNLRLGQDDRANVAPHHYDTAILADAPLLAHHAEATVLVAAAEATRDDSLVLANGRLQAAHARVLGSLLIRHNPRHGSSGYGYAYYEYGTGQG